MKIAGSQFCRASFTEMVAFLGECPEPRPVLLVEKTDRLYRNIKDWVTIGDLDLEVHLVKEGAILMPQEVRRAPLLNVGARRG